MIEEKIIKIVNKSNFEKGKKINPDDISSQKTITIFNNDKILKYKIKSANSDNIYTVTFIMKNDEIISSNCTCPMCEQTGSCKHIAAILLNKSSDFFPTIIKETIQINNKIDISKQIINELYTSKSIQKQKIKLDIELEFESKYYRKGLYIYLKVGIDKTYSTTSKVNAFLNAYKNKNDVIYFGKSFTYDPSTQIFNDVDTKILDYICNVYHTSAYSKKLSIVFIEEHLILEFMELLKNKSFLVKPHYSFDGYIEANPFMTKLTKKDDIYTFELKTDENYHYLDYSKNFVTDNEKLYKIPNDLKRVLEILKNYHTDFINFTKDDINKFVKGIGSLIDDNVNIEENIKDEFITITPNVLLYFDFDDEILCNIKFDYHNKIVNIFDKTNDFLRNSTFEEEALNDILNNNFRIDNQMIYLQDIDDYDYFIQNTLPYLNEKYTVYTTEKFDNIDIKKETNITSHFSIGQDNIFKIDFDLDGINKDDLKDIFENIDMKKKYYKLKNGSLLNLQDNNLNELKNLVNDMELDVNKIDKDYTIPKYRAIYLDSLKEKKYKIIKTNNKFKQFIDNFKKYKDISLEVDDNILRNYQLTGLKWLYNIYKCGFGGVLADEMGLGKSIQTIYLIKQVLKENKNFKILIVAPTSLIYNWENEFNKFGHELNYKVIAGAKNKRQDTFKNINNINILITTYGLIREDNEYYKNINFELMIIDEAQNIKNPLSASTKMIKSINSNIRLALTGTPLENSVLELWSIFDFIMPGYLNTLSKFNEKYKIKDIDDDSLQILNTLNMQISPFILRRKKQDVLTDLPPKIENNIYLELDKEQKLVYVKEVKKTQKEMDEMIRTEGFLKARFKILSLLTRLRQICIDPKIIYDDYHGTAIKVEEVCSTIKKIVSDNHKILIFTSYKKALEIVKDRLEKENITTYVIDGSVSSKKRNELVNNFNNDDTNVFLIMLKAGGTGLNLTGADVVIHLDLWWNPQAENQATDRAHRIGQKKTVQVIKFICKGTIEERILELQNKKKILSDTLIEGESRDENIVSTLSEDDFRTLLSYSEE